MRVGAVQLNIVKNDKIGNLEKVEKLLKDKGLDLAVLPELFSTGYFYDTEEEREVLAEAIPGGITTERLIDISKKTGTSIVGALLEKENENLYITAVAVGPEGYLGKHRKKNLTSDEKKIYSRGENSLVFDIKGTKVGVIICFEGWIPESVRELTLKGAQIIAQTALICNEKSLEIMKIRAIENNSYAVIANACSTETYKGSPVTFRGESRIIDFNGEILTTASNEETLISFEINEDLTKEKKLPDTDNLIEEIMLYK